MVELQTHLLDRLLLLKLSREGLVVAGHVTVREEHLRFLSGSLLQ